MSKLEIKRRAVLGAFVLTSIIVLSGALAQPRAPFGGVRVDVTSLRAEAGDPTARWAAEELPRALTEALASVGRAGAPVRARIDRVVLGRAAAARARKAHRPIRSSVRSSSAAWRGRSARSRATIRWPSTRRSSSSPTATASRGSCRPSPIGRPGKSEVAGPSCNAELLRYACEEAVIVIRAIQVVDQIHNRAGRGGLCRFSWILVMILTLNTRLTDRIADWLGRRLARYLAQPVKDFVPLATADPKAFLRVLRPGDIVLVEGNTRVSTAIKYLTQSTWSHSSLYVGPISGRGEPSGEPHVLVEADVEHGVLSAPASKYSRVHTRICRPIGLSADDVRAITDFAVDRIGMAYDLRNTFDLLRYLLPTPPVPSRFRRRMIALGAGSPTRAICSTLIAQAFQTINYPICRPSRIWPQAKPVSPLWARKGRAKSRIFDTIRCSRRETSTSLPISRW